MTIGQLCVPPQYAIASFCSKVWLCSSCKDPNHVDNNNPWKCGNGESSLYALDDKIMCLFSFAVMSRSQ